MGVVVGVAILEQGRLLAARRAHPPALAGLWELPGGKVEAGEELAEAAVREIAEELGCAVVVTGELAGSTRVPTEDAELSLQVLTARLADGDPVPREHDAVRWLGPTELDEVSWAAPDVPFLAPLRDLLTTAGNH